jgi:diadenosine tetraphosphate (Ap4A) HIT family hydrolase
MAILRAPFLIPDVILESDTCLAIRHPKPLSRIHYVLFPKHDTKNITTLTPADSPYVLGCFALARDLVLRDKLQAYRFYTNGPKLQEIAYLHFHLIAK